jgi:hypothetical protein
MMLCRYHESSNPGEESSVSRPINGHSARANSEQGSSLHSTSTQRAHGRGDNPNGQSEVDDDRRHPPDPFSASDPSTASDPTSSQSSSSPPNPSSDPDTDSQPREISHDTNISLEILLDGNSKGHFLELQTSVKVCLVTIAFEISLNLLQFYPIPNENERSARNIRSKPKIEAHVARLMMFRSPSVKIDNASGSLGFLTDDRSYLRFRDL